MDDLFRPRLGTWTTVSPALATARRIVLVLTLLVPWMLVSGALWFAMVRTGDAGPWPLVVLAVLVLGSAAWGWRWAGLNQRSWAYLETDEDLLVSRGVLFRRIVAIPYARMQFVDVSAGPLARRLGIATVTLHTASTETAADIPGVPAAEATRLRNQLTELGEAHGAGI